MFGGIVTSPRNTLSPKQELGLARIYFENAHTSTDIKLTLVLCHDTEVSLIQAKKGAKQAKDNAVRDGVAAMYINLGLLLHSYDYQSEAQSRRPANWGDGSLPDSLQLNRDNPHEDAPTTSQTGSTVVSQGGVTSVIQSDIVTITQTNIVSTFHKVDDPKGDMANIP
ncbi:hypothetical protein BGX31_000492 [Mortierella sp. GBA43]|nr:hypothetical protein BGX31_000492 [Mortierella sp. GBA43]